MEKEAPKQWIILRKDLKMGKGKMIAQGAHASMAAILQLMERSPCDMMDAMIDGMPYPGTEYKFYVCNHQAVHEWLSGSFTKIALSVNSEEELVSLYERAKKKPLVPCSLIEDKGLTVFNGVKTKTAIAIGPAYPSDVGDLVSDLKLL